LRDRLYFADNLRIWLITLVVLHHLAIVYTGVGAFYYVEPPPSYPLPLVVLVIFIVVNQAYFMGLLFLISGYFSPGSLERKGVRRFVKDRLIRLGILCSCTSSCSTRSHLSARTQCQRP
jgi:fucose 4-O-acetylase-like acetyltransferase